jgi:hypothetical protein
MSVAVDNGPMFDQLLSQWNRHRGLTGPPSDAIELWCDDGRSVWIGDCWGPAVPYGPVDHGNGHRNHGYTRTKGDAQVVEHIPEAIDCPIFIRFLSAVNAVDSPVESVGCEKGFFPAIDRGDASVQLGAYVDLIFTDADSNDRPENSLLLASHLLRACVGCATWWGQVAMVLQRMRYIEGTHTPWGLMLRIDNYGRSEAEALKYWETTVERLARAVIALPRDLKWRAA